MSRYILFTEKKNVQYHLEKEKQKLPKQHFNSINKANDYAIKLIEDGVIGEDRQIVAFNNHTGAIINLPIRQED